VHWIGPRGRGETKAHTCDIAWLRQFTDAGLYAVARGGAATMKIRLVQLGIGAVTCFVFTAWYATPAQQSKFQGTCFGLHAGITAELTQGDSDPSVMVVFHLLNDSDTPQSTAPESWKIVVDGKELSDSGLIFGNGPEPSGGYETLVAGATFHFGKALQIAQYFPETRKYKISWKGRQFQSPTVTISIPKSKH
jgi:hypothetical protein